MSRARNIKPGFFKNDVLVELPFEYRLLFIGLWTMADREGRLEDRPKRIRMEVFPADDVDVDVGLRALHEAGFIHRYEAAGQRYIAILAWSKHQNPHVKEAASLIPAPCEHRASTVLASGKHQNGTRAARLIPDSGFLIPDSGSPSAHSASEHPRGGTPEDSQLPDGVDPERWQSYRDQLADDGKLSISRIKTALLQLRRVIRDGHDPNAVLTAAVMRGLRDLDDTAQRLAREAAQHSARDGPPRVQSRQAQAIAALNEVTDRVTAEQPTTARLADPRTAGRSAQAGLPEPGIAPVR